jgi:tRNA nucleotidyltransferase/poly(A) polymerase
MPTLSPDAQCRFATELVRRLRGAGFEAYWAGGCVRDRLLGRTPKDYDVATDARPGQVRELFGHRRTLALGAAFGVIAVLGPKDAGQVEVATFRRDATYSDGRRPDHVTFSSAAEDAARRDFTINGLFFDPLDERVLDFVGGQEDLARHVIRAIGDPYQRFQEDKLRLLRAVRFASTFEFDVDPRTLEAVGRMAGEITVVSAERIAAEMERMLVDPHRVHAVRLLLQTGLAAPVLPEIVPASPEHQGRMDATLAVLDRLAEPGFPLALATLLHPCVDAAAAVRVCQRWRLSNRQTQRTAWLVEHHAALREPRSLRWSQLQPFLVSEGIDDLLAMEEAAALAAGRDPSHMSWCRSLLTQSREVLDPPPLLTGDDLMRHGIPPGPAYRILLQRLREAQLDGEIRTREEALGLASRLGGGMNDE